MYERKQMYQILGEIVKSAELMDKDKVLRLNGKYKSLTPKVYGKPLTELDFQYDNCRNACVMSVTMLKESHEELISDAKKRLSELPKP